MGYKDIVAGDHLAKPLGARAISSSKGTPGIEVRFQLQTGDTINWVGWLTPNAMERTMETLVGVLGFNGDDAVDEQSRFKPSSLNLEKEVKLVVEMETRDGKTYPKVSWVNSVDSVMGFKSIEPKSVKGTLAQLGFKAAFITTKQKLGLTAPAPEMEDDSVPF